MLVGKEFTFDSAHFIEAYQGKCEALHGHTYRLKVVIEGAVGEDGMVMDFKELKNTVKEKVLDKLDHTLINNVVGGKSTVENIVVWIWKQLQPALPLYELTLWENQTSFVIYRGE